MAIDYVNFIRCRRTIRMISRADCYSVECMQLVHMRLTIVPYEIVFIFSTNCDIFSNPNEPRSRTKTRGSGEVEWPAYDLEIQQMLQFGECAAVQ